MKCAGVHCKGRLADRPPINNFVAMVNCFLLHDDPAAAAADLCDDHVVKLGMEAAEVAADVFHVLAPEAEPPLPFGAESRGHRHLHARTKAGAPGKSHPLILWASGCRANVLYVLEHALAIFEEHRRRQLLGMGRTCTYHKARPYAYWLRGAFAAVDFNSRRAHDWRAGQLEGAFSDSGRYRRDWWAAHGPPAGADLNRCARSAPPQIMNAQAFAACLQPDNLDHVLAYRLYYAAKVRAGLSMRYYYTDPPAWLLQLLGPDAVLLRREPAPRKPRAKRRSPDAPSPVVAK